MKFIVGQKKEMTRVYVDGKMIPVTKVFCPSIHITQVKTQEKEGHKAVQVGYYPKKKVTKSFLGRIKNLPLYARYKEFRLDTNDQGNFEVGKMITVAGFQVGDKVKVTGYSKGRGFAGVVKRHGFAGARNAHGNKDQTRMPGSIGAQGPQHVFKGTRMGGRYGNERITVDNLEVIQVDETTQTIALKGAVPGHRNAFLFIKAQGEMDFDKMQVMPESSSEVEVKEEKKEEGVEAPKEEVQAEMVSIEGSQQAQTTQEVKEEKQV